MRMREKHRSISLLVERESREKGRQRNTRDMSLTTRVTFTNEGPRLRKPRMRGRKKSENEIMQGERSRHVGFPKIFDPCSKYSPIIFAVNSAAIGD